MKHTPWFPCDIKPVRVGPYQTRVDDTEGGVSFNYWNGACWLTTTDGPSEPFSKRASMIQEIEWRGLTKEAA